MEKDYTDFARSHPVEKIKRFKEAE